MAIQTSISGSVRKKSNQKKMFFCVNIKPSVALQLGLKNRPYVRINRTNDSFYKITFQETDSANCQAKVTFKNDDGSACVFVEQSIFLLNSEESIPARTLNVELIDNVLTFEFNQEQFLNPSEVRANDNRTVRRIESTAQKVEAGFDAEGSWGMPLYEKADAAILKIGYDSLEYKLKAYRANNP